LEESPVILVVEDDPPIQIVVEDALADGGFEPAITASGEEAVTLLKRHKGKYQALVVDIALVGRLDGWEVAKRAREIDPAFPILYITAADADRWPSQGVPNSSLLTNHLRQRNLSLLFQVLLLIVQLPNGQWAPGITRG
jgi:PleD family two-component response regulator